MGRRRTTPEGQVLKACRAYLEAIGAVVIRNNSGGLRDGTGRLVRFGEVGSSDLLVCYRGRFVAVECKAATNRLTPAQAVFLDRVRQGGGLAFVVRSVGELIEALQAERLA